MAEEEAPRAQTIADYLEAGIAAARAGQGPLARTLLSKVVEQDAQVLAAWQWLSRVVTDPEEREICLENVLVLDPQDAPAREELARLRAELPPLPAPEPAATEAPPPPLAEGELPMPPLINLEDRFLCPYCAARTRFEEHRCPRCRGALWRRSRQQEERTESRIGFVLGLQAIACGLNAAAIVLLLLYVSLQVRHPGVWPMLRLYLGLRGVPDQVVGAALAVLPRQPILILGGLFLLSLVVLVGIYLRWRGAFYLFLVNGAGLAITGLLTTLTLWPAVSLGNATLDSIARIAMLAMDLAILGVVLGLALEMRDDFFFEQERIVYRLAPQAVEGIDFLAHGQRCAQEGMWALAAIHFRRAIDALSDDFEAELKLAATYSRLGRRGPAQHYLERARRSRPDDPRVSELERWLKQPHG